MKVYVAYQHYHFGYYDEGISKIFDSEEKAIAWVNDAPEKYDRQYEELEVE